MLAAKTNADSRRVNCSVGMNRTFVSPAAIGAALGFQRFRLSQKSPKQSFAAAESGHLNSVKLTFADEAGGTSSRSPTLTTGGAARR